MDFKIDWYHPSENRLYAFDLENNTYIYLDREMFLLYMRPYWRDKKEEQRHRQIMVSLDELHDLYELELDEQGHLITKDNYYQFSYEEDMDEEDFDEEEIDDDEELDFGEDLEGEDFDDNQPLSRISKD